MEVECKCDAGKHICLECPDTFKQSEEVAAAFGLWPMNLLHKGHYWKTDEGHGAAGPTERHMWHHLVQLHALAKAAIQVQRVLGYRFVAEYDLEAARAIDQFRERYPLI